MSIIWGAVAGAALAGVSWAAAGEGALERLFETTEPERLATGFSFTEGPVKLNQIGRAHV